MTNPYWKMPQFLRWNSCQVSSTSGRIRRRSASRSCRRANARRSARPRSMPCTVISLNRNCRRSKNTSSTPWRRGKLSSRNPTPCVRSMRSRRKWKRWTASVLSPARGWRRWSGIWASPWMPMTLPSVRTISAARTGIPRSPKSACWTPTGQTTAVTPPSTPSSTVSALRTGVLSRPGRTISGCVRTWAGPNPSA